MKHPIMDPELKAKFKGLIQAYTEKNLTSELRESQKRVELNKKYLDCILNSR